MEESYVIKGPNDRSVQLLEIQHAASSHAIPIITSAGYSSGVKKEMNLTSKVVSDDSVQPFDLWSAIYRAVIVDLRVTCEWFEALMIHRECVQDFHYFCAP